jgi:uncharacterized delta-60 repeat protein
VNAGSSGVAVQDDGQILVIGSTGVSCSHEWNRYALVRYDPDGELDPTFGAGGVQTTNWGSVGSSLYSVAFQSDGKIVVAGSRYAGGCSPGINLSTVTRYTTYGELDTSFGSSGETRRDIPSGPHHDHNKGVAIRADDSIVTTGSEHYGSWAGLQTYDRDGDFASDRFISPDYSGGITTDSLDRVVANTTHKVIRLDSAGSLDGTFGAGGYGDETWSPYVSTANALAIDDDNRTLVLSHETDLFRVVRLLEDGTLDSSFGVDGAVEVNPGYSMFRSMAVATQPDGSILIGGISDGLGDIDFAVARVCP